MIRRNRTARNCGRDYRRLLRARPGHPPVSAWMPRGRPPRTPRNGGKFVAISRSGPANPGDADWLAERMEFELPVFPVGRIGSESGPPNSATEINAISCPPSARNSPSPVRIRLCPPPKTPRKRGSFWDGRGVRVRSLCNRRLGGGESGIRTHGTLSSTRALQARAFSRSAISPRGSRIVWRRGGDSNPRYGFWPYNGLANRRLQPLGHLSARAGGYRNPR